MKATRTLAIARAIQAEIGGNVRRIQAKVAGVALMNPTWTDEELACHFAIHN